MESVTSAPAGASKERCELRSHCLVLGTPGADEEAPQNAPSNFSQSSTSEIMRRSQGGSNAPSFPLRRPLEALIPDRVAMGEVNFSSRRTVSSSSKRRIPHDRRNESWMCSRNVNWGFSCCLMLTVVNLLVGVEGQQPQLGGSWQLMIQNAGIASSHTAITRFGHAVLLDRRSSGPSQMDLTAAQCTSIGGNGNNSGAVDCTAHSVLLVPEGLVLRALIIRTDPGLSSGQFGPNGTLIQTGGMASKQVRFFTPCPPGGGCDWDERASPTLQADREFSTNQLLPDGRLIIVGGKNQPNVEFFPSNGEGLVALPFLADSRNTVGDSLYPVVHLLPDGNLFIMIGTASIVYNWVNNTVVKTLPNITGEPRTYPFAGSSVMLPLTEGTNYAVADVLVCGGADFRAAQNPSGQFPASDSCGKIRVTDPNPVWVMETMPFRRCMGDMVLLPTRNVLIINGAQKGAQGFTSAFDPALNPVLYEPNAPQGLRFTMLSPSATPRMYPSTANLLPDGRVMVAGSSPHFNYTFLVGQTFTDGNYPTDLSVEAFSPPYLGGSLTVLKPSFITVPTNITYGQSFVLTVTVDAPVVGNIFLSLLSAPFTTHSFSQGQRILAIGSTIPIMISNKLYQIASIAPPSRNVAPPGYYMLFAVNQGVPSVGAWVQLSD
ncbi:hypothetical protein R1flu_028161 [Riccia fluitans]|uniref:Glyoxal oxidase n=1 Tax=Riccia fluitans TaxID=41844 RepID=A0ABD1XLJ6_9MARC